MTREAKIAAAAIAAGLIVIAWRVRGAQAQTAPPPNASDGVGDWWNDWFGDTPLDPNGAGALCVSGESGGQACAGDDRAILDADWWPF